MDVEFAIWIGEVFVVVADFCFYALFYVDDVIGDLLLPFFLAEVFWLAD